MAVVVGTLTSSQLFQPGGHDGTASSAAASIPAVEASAAGAQATPILVGQHVQWIRQEPDGSYRVASLDVRSVCPEGGAPCDTAAPAQDQPVEFATHPESVFGSRDGNELIVVNDSTTAGPASVAVVQLRPAASGEPSPSAPDVPSATPTVTASTEPTTSAAVSASIEPSATPAGSASITPSTSPASEPPASSSPTPATGSTRPSSIPSESPIGTPVPSTAASPSVEPTASAAATSVPPSTAPTTSPTVAVTASPTAGGTVQIARDVVLVGQSAAYSPTGGWFAFTARPADGSIGPDIYVWKVGETTARTITTDHHSTFGSWIGSNDVMVGSTTAGVAKAAADAGDTASFLLDPATGTRTEIPQTGRTWRPSVDPTGRRAVYWTGSVRRSDTEPVDVPDAGRLVIGDWATGDAAPSDRPEATPLSGDQSSQRHETTIADGRMADWDARWDATGTRLAVWIADRDDPQVGRLSLYAVDPFDGRVDLKKPLLNGRRATAGFAISSGKIVWAEPASDGSGTGGRIFVFAWTDQGTGTLETLPDKVIVIR